MAPSKQSVTFGYCCYLNQIDKTICWGKEGHRNKSRNNYYVYLNDHCPYVRKKRWPGGRKWWVESCSDELVINSTNAHSGQSFPQHSILNNGGQGEEWNKWFVGSILVLGIQFGSLAQSCPTLCGPMDCGTPGFPIHHQLPELAQTHVHRVRDAIQPSHPLSSPSPPAFNLEHQGLFQWVSSSHQVAKVLELQLQHQSFQWIFRTDFL